MKGTAYKHDARCNSCGQPATMECVACCREARESSKNAFCSARCFQVHWRTHQNPQTPVKGMSVALEGRQPPHTTGNMANPSRGLFANGRGTGAGGSYGEGNGFPTQRNWHQQNVAQASPSTAFSPAEGFRPHYTARAVAAGVPAFNLG